MSGEIARAVDAENGHDATGEEGLDNLALLVLRSRFGDVETCFVPQDLGLKPLELGAWLDTQLLDEACARVLVHLERLRLAPGAI